MKKMVYIDTVWTLAQQFVADATMVTINDAKIWDVATEIVDTQKNQLPVPAEFTKHVSPPDEIRKMFLYELIANSVNYCFWYGRHDIRPNDVSSSKMYALLDESFHHIDELKKTRTMDRYQELEDVIEDFTGKLSRARFPLIDCRVRHLEEILDRHDLLSVIDTDVERGKHSVDEWLDFLVTSFPGYAKDLFLKRAFLFIMQMYRRCGLFAEEMFKIPVPADYQIPKMLRWTGCIVYDRELSWIVDENVIVPSGSFIECEIRAATIVAVKRIADAANCTCEEVDTYLFARRYFCSEPFHLTITTDY